MTDKPVKTPVTAIWNGPYQTWAAACSAAKNLNKALPAFSSQRWLNRIKQQLMDYRNEFSQYATPQATPEALQSSRVVALLPYARSLVDFGGSSGWAMDYLQNTLATHKINSYAIVELESVVKFIQDSGLLGKAESY